MAIGLVCASPLLAMVLLPDILGKSPVDPLAALIGALSSAGFLEAAMMLVVVMSGLTWLILDFACGDLGWLLRRILGWLLCG